MPSATKTIELVISGSAGTIELLADPIVSYDDVTGQIVLTQEPVFSVTPDNYVLYIGQIVFSSEETWSEEYTNTVDPERFPIYWPDFTVIMDPVETTDHFDILGGPYTPDNEWIKIGYRLIATKDGYFPLEFLAGPIEVPKFALVSGTITISGGSNPLAANDVVTVTSNTIFTREPQERFLTAHLILPDGSEIEIPADDAGTPATISLVGSTTGNTSITLHPSTQAGDVALLFLTGAGLDISTLITDFWNPIPEVLYEFEVNGVIRRSIMLWKALSSNNTAVPSIVNGHRTIATVWRGVSQISPIIVATANKDLYSGTLPFPALSNLPTGAHIIRAVHFEQKVGLMPEDPVLTKREGLDAENLWNRIALWSSNGILLSIAAADVAIPINSRAMAAALALRPGTV
jgi:hypothetical protein